MMKRGACILGVGLLLAGLGALAAEPAAKVVVGDVVFERKTKGDEDFAPAVFPHWVHRVKYKCYVCHNDTVGFKMKAGSAAITMDLIDQGKFCGQCHKGKPAFGISFETCIRCHRK